MVHRSDQEKSVSKIRVSKMSGLENRRDAQTMYLGPEPLLRHTKARNLPVGRMASNSGNLGREGFYVKIPLRLGSLSVCFLSRLS